MVDTDHSIVDLYQSYLHFHPFSISDSVFVVDVPILDTGSKPMFSVNPWSARVRTLAVLFDASVDSHAVIWP